MLVCSSPGGGNSSVVSYRFDSATGTLTESATSPAENPYYLSVHPTGKYAYTVDRVSDGIVSAYRIDSSDTTLTRVNRQPSGGAGPCYVSVNHDGSYVFVANYGGGTVSALPVGDDGRLGRGTTIRFKGESESGDTHPHSAALGSVENIVYVPDLGRDRIVTFRLKRDGTLDSTVIPDVTVPSGTGPRHFDCHPNGQFVYVVNELNSTLTGFEVVQATGVLREIGTVNTVLSPFDGENSASDVRVHPSGQWAYASNRGHDSIAFFAVDDTCGQLDPRGTVCAGGRTPRTIALDPTGRFLFAANKDSGGVAVFEIDTRTGTPCLVSDFSVPKPMCVQFVESR